MFKTSRTFLSAAVLAAVTANCAHAALVARGNGLIYDTTLNVTWMADMNYAKTQYAASNGAQGYSDGKMIWDQANTWANNLVYQGMSGWRLPTLNPNDASCSRFFNGLYFGYGCTGGELSHLFVVDLGGKPAESVLIQTGDTPEQIANLALFSNLQDWGYWSGTEYWRDPQNSALSFDVDFSHQTCCYKGDLLFAVAVRDGDVAAGGNDVPEPSTLALLPVAALAAWGAARRRRAG